MSIVGEIRGGASHWKKGPLNWIDPFGLSCKKEIALGKDPYFKMLAEKVGAVHWKNWSAEGITRRTVYRRFGKAFHQAAKRAKHIHFALDGVHPDKIADAVGSGKGGFYLGNYTNAELHHIATNPGLLRKTTFYRNSAPIPMPDFGRAIAL